MKKCIIILLLLSIVLNIEVFALADEKHDSVNIWEEEMQILETSPRYDGDAVVIKLFEFRDFLKFVGDGWDVHTIAFLSEAVYLHTTPAFDEPYFQIIDGNESKDCYPEVSYYSWTTLCPYIVQPEKVVGSSAQVQNIYCFDAEHYGVFVIYCTDQGDYVLFKQMADMEEMYLFTYEELLPLAQKFVREIWGNAQLGAGQGGLESVCDLEQFRFDPDAVEKDPVPDHQDPTQPGDDRNDATTPSIPDDDVTVAGRIAPVVVCVAIVVAAGVIVIVLRKKRKSV